MKIILKCGKCGSYTLKERCSCSGKGTTPKPAKFSPDDKYAPYRRKAKSDEYEKRGFL